MRNINTNYFFKKLFTTTLLIGAATVAHAEEGDMKTSFYGSLRLGIDSVDSGSNDDAANGRDFLSRIGTKSSVDLGNGLTGLAVVEYGLRGDDGVNFVQNQKPGLRQVYIGLKGSFGKVTYGSQTIMWHNFVRGAYFSDGLDSLRQGAIRDDDLLQWEKKTGKWKFGAALQTEKQDGDSFDQYQVGVEYKSGPLKLQAAVVTDQRGDNTGNLVGVRGWYNISKNVTVSAFHHQASEDFDIYSGNSSGNVRTKSTKSGNAVGGITSCKNEDRTTTGIYGKWKQGKNQFHARYAVNACDIKGDASSIKVEYVRYLSKKFKMWVAFEQLDNDTSRLPSTGKDMSELQLGARFDF